MFREFLIGMGIAAGLIILAHFMVWFIQWYRGDW
jgi:hypothetical protein